MTSPLLSEEARVKMTEIELSQLLRAEKGEDCLAEWAMNYSEGIEP